MMTLTINKKKVRAKKGETVLEVAQREGIYVPKLCYLKGVTPYGGCRLCLVKVKGWEKPVTSCTLLVEDGMVVETETPLLKRLRRFSLQLILSEHPHACLVCEKRIECADYQECIQKTAITSGCKFCARNGNCELQELIDYLKIEEIPFSFKYRNMEIEKCDPFFERDYNLCILCGRCIRACQEIREAGTLDFHHRGPETMVGTAYGLPHLESGCQFCGACVDVCPTGALRERYSKWEGVPEKSVQSTCLLCNIGCSIDLKINDKKLINTTPTHEQICVRGRFGIAPLVYHPKRITQPLLKKGDRLVQVEWKEALAYVAETLKAYTGKTGILFTPQMPVKAIDSIYALARHLKSTIAAPLALDAVVRPFDVKKFERGSVILIVNTDMVSDFAPVLLHARKHSKMQHRIIVIDAVKSRVAEMADLWLQPRPGKESDLVRTLFAGGRIGKSVGVSQEDYTSCRDAVKEGPVYLLFNADNMKGMKLPKRVSVLPLASSINTLKILEMGTDDSAERVLKDKSVDCLYTIGVAPRLDRKYKRLIVQDSFPPSFDFDLFLPAASFVEIDGTVVNINGKIKRLHKATEPLGNSRPDLWIIKEIGKALNCDLTKRTIRRKRRGKKSQLRKITVTKKYPLYLIVRKNSFVYRGHMLSALMKGFERLRYDNRIWINSATARKLKIADGADVRVIGQAIDLTLPARITDHVPPDSALIYAHPSLAISGDQSVRIECIKS
ncbi:MAG: molybdopterin-dependent oxidoreductase [candidate division WOR-3 bacterium]|nr:MAG: molybdopterin-dependent oxidoreductase [candidate division WOR-3 bacterium]